MQKIFANKEIKNGISVALTIFIGLIGSAMGDWNIKADKYFWIKFCTLVFFSIIFVGFTVFSYIYDKKDKKELADMNALIIAAKEKNDLLAVRINAFEKSQLYLATIMSKTADDINVIANSIQTDKKVSIENWNFKKECKWICEKVLELIEITSEEGNSFAVSIFQIDPLKSNKNKAITMIAHSCRYGPIPDVYEIPIIISKNPEFYAVKLFKRAKHAPDILIDRNEVNEKFIYKDENEHPDYSQYIGIPIHCSGRNMLSLLQIVAFGDSKVGLTKCDISEKVNKYIMSYTQLGLMMYKIEKGFINSGYLMESIKGGIE